MRRQARDLIGPEYGRNVLLLAAEFEARSGPSRATDLGFACAAAMGSKVLPALFGCLLE